MKQKRKSSACPSYFYYYTPLHPLSSLLPSVRHTLHALRTSTKSSYQILKCFFGFVLFSFSFVFFCFVFLFFFLAFVNLAYLCIIKINEQKISISRKRQQSNNDKGCHCFICCCCCCCRCSSFKLHTRNTTKRNEKHTNTIYIKKLETEPSKKLVSDVASL